MRTAVEEGGAVDNQLLRSVCTLAQILVDTGQSKEAVKWLEDDKIGPMTLIKSDSPATKEESFRVDTHIIALRAYVGAEELEKAEKTVDSLEALVGQGNDADAATRLTKVYYRLGRDLEELLARLRNERKFDQLESVTESFEEFLKRIPQREQGNNYNSLSWVAETFFSLGAGMDPGGRQDAGQGQGLLPPGSRYLCQDFQAADGRETGRRRDPHQVPAGHLPACHG